MPVFFLMARKPLMRFIKMIAKLGAAIILVLLLLSVTKSSPGEAKTWVMNGVVELFGALVDDNTRAQDAIDAGERMKTATVGSLPPGVEMSQGESLPEKKPPPPSVTGGVAPDVNAQHIHPELPVVTVPDKPPPSPEPIRPKPGMVYFLGDSYGEGIQNIEQAFPGGWRAKISWLRSRKILGGPSPNGYQQAGIDYDIIKHAQAVVVLLGTNPENDFEQGVRKLIKRLHAYIKPGTPVFWVNVFHADAKLTSQMIRVNQSLERLKRDLGFRVIDWRGMAYASYSWFEKGNAHPNRTGFEKLENKIIRTITKRSAVR